MSRVEDFYSSKINTCVQVEVADSGKDWSFYLRDVTNGFLRGPKLAKSEQPLSVYHHEYRSFATASAEGFWQATDSGSDRQLVGQIAVMIECSRSEGVCREADAQVFGGLIKPALNEFAVSSWTTDGIIADDSVEGACGIGHRLSIDFNANSVIVTDYPKTVAGGSSCKPFQVANSFALHGGSLGYFSMNQIFSCDSSGVNNAVIEKVNQLNGAVADKAYDLWMDNAEGGPAATNKTPPKPYTQADCARLMEKKLVELKSAD